MLPASAHCGPRVTSQVRTTCGNGNGNGGWNQGIMNAALLGDAKIAAAQSLNRAHTPSGKGYRFLGFALPAGETVNLEDILLTPPLHHD